MAMNTDIRISVSFKNHRKRKRLKLLLGEGSTDYLLDLWIATAMNHPSGFLDGMDEIDIALEAGWDGDALEFCSALIECRFLEKDDSGVYFLHDWDDHQPHVVDSEERSERSRNAVNVRWKKYREEKRIHKELLRNASRAKAEHEQNTDRIGTVYDPNTESNSPTYLPTYQPNQDQILSSSPDEKKNKKDSSLPSIETLFNEFWPNYPKKADKGAARKAFMAIFKGSENNRSKMKLLTDNMAAHLHQYLEDVKESNPKYIKNPATWLRAQDFLEPPPELEDAAIRPVYLPVDDGT